MTREVKVGAFVLIGLLAVGIIVFLIGDEQNLFTRKTEYHTEFQEVKGLKRGASVAMGGIDIGVVTSVDYPKDPSDPMIRVRFRINNTTSNRLRADSTAKIEAKGLLGDQTLVLSPGTQGDVVAPGGLIRGVTEGGLDSMMEQVAALGVKADSVMGNLELTTGALAEEDVQRDFRRLLGAMSSVAQSLERKEGYVGKLLADPDEAARLSRAVENLERTTAQLDRALVGVNRIIDRVNQGPGFAHDIVYGQGPADSIAKIGGAADEVAISLREIREGNGPARSLLYGDENSDEMVANLNVMSGDLRSIVSDVRAGRGTLGALLVDPSVYEDLKILLGNVDRNRTLRALVRYSIQQDETPPEVEVRDPGQRAGASAPPR